MATRSLLGIGDLHRPEDRDPSEVSVVAILRVYDPLVLLPRWHKLVLTRHKLLLVIVVRGEAWGVKDVELDQLCEGHPLLINGTVACEVDTLEAWEVVLGVLVDAKGDLTGRDLCDVPLSDDLFDGLLQAVAAIHKSLYVVLKALQLQVLGNNSSIIGLLRSLPESGSELLKQLVLDQHDQGLLVRDHRRTGHKAKSFKRLLHQLACNHDTRALLCSLHFLADSVKDLIKGKFLAQRLVYESVALAKQVDQLLVEHFEEHLGRILALLVSFDGVSEVLLELAIDKPSDTVADQIAKVGATVWVEIQHTHAVSRYAVQAKIGVL